MAQFSTGKMAGKNLTLQALKELDVKANQRVELLSGERYQTGPNDLGAGVPLDNGLFANPVFDREPITTTELINSTSPDEYTETTGFLTDGGGGNAPWNPTGNTIAVSLSPSQTGDTTLSNGNGKEFRLVADGAINVQALGAVADGATDNSLMIEAAMVRARVTQGTVFFPANNSAVDPSYNHSLPIEYKASEVIIEGESNKVKLNYTGVVVGLTGSLGVADLERCGLRNITLTSTTGLVAFDFTKISYGNFENIEIAYSAPNASLIFGKGNDGTGPYYNKFNGITLFGGIDLTQEGIRMEPDASGNFSDGPNANIFSDFKRMALLSRAINIKSGSGNLFTNISSESIGDAGIVLNDVDAFAETGTSTSTLKTSLTDTSKVWSTVIGNPLNFTNATVTLTSGIPNQSRKIVGNTVDTLSLDKPFSEFAGNTVGYRITRPKANNNKFVNVRQEGLDSENPDGIRIMAGALGNEFSNLEIGSLGGGMLFDDKSEDQTNKVQDGDLIVYQYVLEDVGPSATVNVIPRNSVFGGIRTGSNMSIQYVEMTALNLSGGLATLTVDHGGAVTGGGSETLITKIDSTTGDDAYISGSKLSKDTTNSGIFAELSTNGSVNASADFLINIAIRA